MKLTGERPIEGTTPDSLLALHAAGYREVALRLGAGRFLDVGCGLGDGTAQFVAGDREVVGVDYDPATAHAAAERLVPGGAFSAACMDGAALALRPGAFDWACSSHRRKYSSKGAGFSKYRLTSAYTSARRSVL